MGKLFGVFISCFVFLLSFGQAPRIQWQRCLGGSGNEEIGSRSGFYSSNSNALTVTSNNRYIVGGESSSSDGDVNINLGSTDLWLVCLDQYGSTLWEKSYGGSSEEIMGGIQETADHGFFVMGSTRSNDGNVSGNHGDIDIWVLRLDSIGNIVWQKCFGGSNIDLGSQIRATPDNGCIITGFTKSSNGDIQGLHAGIEEPYTEADSTGDSWIVKLDAIGAIQWQRCLGGTGSDHGISITLEKDGGYMTGNRGYSLDGDLDVHCKSSGNWLVKLDQDGRIVWQTCDNPIPTYNMEKHIEVSGGGYITVGSIYSGDSSGYSFDAYINKFNANGTLLWQKILGDTLNEFFTGVIEQLDSSYIICGIKVRRYEWEGHPPDIWLLKLSADGSVIWETKFGSADYDINPSIVKSTDEGYLLTGVTWGNDRDVTGKHSPATDNPDIWVVKLGSSNTIKGIVFADRNSNGIKDINEPLINGEGLVKSVKNGDERSSVPVNGIFINTVDTGSYTTSVNYSPYFTSLPASKSSAFSTYNNIDSFSFALQPLANKRDLTIDMIPLRVARTGFDLAYKIFFRNAGTDTITSGQILLKKDSRINFISAFPIQTSIDGDTIKWNYGNLKPFDTASIIVNMRVQAPPNVNLNDTLSSIAIITPVAGDLTPADDTALVRLIVQGSFDPNDKTDNLAGKISIQQISSLSYINYLIRFQNTGTDTAFNITIRDTLDQKLDWPSLQMTGASHPYRLNIKSQNQLTWIFNNIRLPDSNRNEKASHGFIAYRLKPKNNLSIGEVIKNTASIYFDYNLPVRTNTQQTIVFRDNIITGINNPQVDMSSMKLFPNPTGERIWLKVKDVGQGNAVVSLIDINGRIIMRKELGNISLADFTTSLDFTNQPPGFYTILLIVGRKQYSQKLIVQ